MTIEIEREPEVLSPLRFMLGENPLWHAEEGALYLTDIHDKKLYRYHSATGETHCIHEGPVVGGFTFQADGSLLLFEANRISVLEADGSRRVLREGIDEEMSRFNDVLADPEGRVLAGTISRDPSRGGLFLIERDGSAENICRGTGCSNGLGFSPDLRHLYWTCTTRRTIFRFDYDAQTGKASGQVPWYQAAPEEGAPDGLTVDARGHVWTCRWGGHSVLELSPQAELISKLMFSARAITSATFGGATLRDLYVTSAAVKAEAPSPSEDGALYRVAQVAQGRPEFRSRVLLG